MLWQLATRWLLSQTVTVGKLAVTCEDIFGSIDYVCTFQPLVSWLALSSRKDVRILRYRSEEQVMLVSHIDDTKGREIVTLKPPRTALLVWCKCEDGVYVLVSKENGDRAYKALTATDIFKLRDVACPERLIQVGTLEQPNACVFFTCHAPNIFSAKSEFVVPVALETIAASDADLVLLIHMAKQNAVFDQNTAD